MDEILDLKDELSRSISQPTKTNTEDTHWQTMFEQEQSEVQALRMALDERSAELDSLRKKLNREMPMTGLLEHSKSPSKHESDEIKGLNLGLRHIVQELQMETLAITQRNKLLEAENRLLISETDQLRQELKILEDNVEQSLLSQEAALNAGDHPSALPPDLQTKYEGEIEQLRKRLADAERKTARVTHNLNKEISELETLIESKDELEQDLERLKEKLSRSRSPRRIARIQPTYKDEHPVHRPR
ncbi:hypothetical protein JVT61DRAFT_14176 [Boletus reticuloceps]|uniref:Uncharacterized protein n=1 Tax=Boletus reticuloceps TaxID=495285 RepID=A0A8I2YD33_9AGAM|nr:hypothetical protein JVT61DRAFT_14176 [Boletus reticuloceps]